MILNINKFHVNANKNIKMSSFKSSENIRKKEGGPDRSVSDNQSSSVTLNELAMKANFEFQQGSRTSTDINLNFKFTFTPLNLLRTKQDEKTVAHHNTHTNKLEHIHLVDIFCVTVTGTV